MTGGGAGLQPAPPIAYAIVILIRLYQSPRLPHQVERRYFIITFGPSSTKVLRKLLLESRPIQFREGPKLRVRNQKITGHTCAVPH